MTDPRTDRPLLVPAATAGDDPRPTLATVVGADFSALSITPSRADQAPSAVRAALERIAPFDARHDLDLTRWKLVDHGDAGATRMAWAEAFDAIAASSERALATGTLVLALGGDHSVTWPLVAGAARSCRVGRLGIVQLDVHHDTRPLDGGPSNGTPIRGLVEQGIVRGGDVVQLGIHPFGNRPPLRAFCDEHGIGVVPLAELAERGPVACMADALARLEACDAIWLTVDIDVLDRAYAPGTVAALPGGIDPATLFALVEAACADRRVIAVDVVEFDPTRDVGAATASSAGLVLLHALSAVARRAVG